MLNRGLVRLLLLFLVLVSPALLRAQFQNPTPDELKMTADPKAPGASAVFLNVSQIASNPLHFESFYARIKILTEKGEELATVELPYAKDARQYEVAAIQGRTIHPDGTITQLTGKPADLLVEKKGNTQFAKKVFTLPNVTVGSIIEYYYQLRYSDNYYITTNWEVQRPYLVHKAHYMFTPYQGNTSMSLWSVLPNGVSVNKDAMGRYTLDVTDIAPSPREEWMPPIGITLFKVIFYFRDSSDVDQFWQAVGNDWAKSVQQFTEPSKAIHEAVNGLIAPGDADLEKAKKLYKAVQAIDNTDFSREKSEAERKELKLKEVKHADDVWTQKSGTGTEIALLYVSMLRAAGLSAYAMRVVDRSQGIFAPGYMYFDQLEDTVVILSIDGKETVLDPGEKMCPFGTVSWKHSTATGLRQTAAASAIATTPQQAYSNNVVQRIADLTIDGHGSVDGNLRFIMTGQKALEWRQKALENDEAEVKKQFDQWIATMVPDGVEAHVDRFTALDDPDSKLAAYVNAQGTLGSATAKRILIPGLFFETRGSHPFVDQDKRLTPVDMRYAEQISDQIVYHLPPSMGVESAPQVGKIPWEGHAVLLIKAKTDPGQVTITRTLARSFTFAGTDDYQNLRDFYQKVAAADQQQLVLTSAPVATPAAGSGN
jgi:hypothetical protein